MGICIRLMMSTSPQLALRSSRHGSSPSLFAICPSPAPQAPIPIAIQGRRLQVTDAIKAYVQDKISRTLQHFAQASAQEISICVFGLSCVLALYAGPQKRAKSVTNIVICPDGPPTSTSEFGPLLLFLCFCLAISSRTSISMADCTPQN